MDKARADECKITDRRVGRQTRILLLLTAVAGCVDVISYLGLKDVFTANMTGNTVLLGIALGQGQLDKAAKPLLALIGFSAGVGFGAALVERHSPGRWTPAVTHALFLEAVVLCLFSLVWQASQSPRHSGVNHLLVVLSAITMGIQSAAVRNLQVPGITTTFVTGTLTSIMTEISGGMRPGNIRDRQNTIGPQPTQLAPPARDAWRQVGVILTYGIAAMISVGIARHLAALWPWLPVILIFSVLAMTWRQ